MMTVTENSAMEEASPAPPISIRGNPHSPKTSTERKKTFTATITPVVTMIAEITVFGHTVANENVSATGRVTVDFVGGSLVTP